MNRYKEIKEKHQKEIKNFPIFFAFSEEQFQDGMKKLDLNENEVDKIVSIGAGGYIKKDDVKKFNEMMSRSRKGIKR